MRFPVTLPFVTVRQAPHDAELGVLVPSNLMRLAPAAHRQIALVADVVAGFFMGEQVGKGKLAMQLVKNVHHVANRNMQATTASRQCRIEFAQTFEQKLIVLIGSILRRPHCRLDHVQTQHRTTRGGERERSVVVQSQVAFEPDKAGDHGRERNNIMVSGEKLRKALYF